MSRVEPARAHGDPGIGPRRDQPRIDPAAVAELNGQIQGLQMADPLFGMRAFFGAEMIAKALRELDLVADRGAGVAKRDAGLLGLVAQARDDARLARLCRDGAFGPDRESPAPAALGEQGGAAGRRGRDQALKQGDEARHWRRLDLGMAGALPLREQDSEIDRLRDQERRGHDQRNLSDQAFRQEALHRAAFTAASLPRQACSRRPRPS